MKKVIVTGCAGFVGSAISERLLKLGYFVTGIDNFSTGKIEFIENMLKKKNFRLIRMDLLNSKKLIKISKGHSAFFHFAANADVKNGLLHPNKDFEQNTMVTFNVLNSMRINKIKKIIFSSTGSIYGEPKSFPTSENVNFPIQTSLYGASKLACEGLIQAFSIGYKMQSYIFRFVSLIGKRYTHGHIFDFYKQLKKNPDKLYVLGDGNQKKSYLNVSDCIDAIFSALKKRSKNIYIYNLGTNNYITIKQSINYILKFLKIKPKVYFKGGKRGWVGDSPKIFLCTKKIRKIGWAPKKRIDQGIFETLRYFQENKWLFKT
jgi:UDP-glucose 4-epimerase